MLQFILGRAVSGKTFEIIKRIKMLCEAGESAVLIVPEQFSFESEREVLKVVEDRLAQNVSVLSFTRLCDEIERVSGGLSGRTITDADRSILMSRAVLQTGEALGPFKRYSASAGFVAEITKIISEFKINAIFPEDISSVADKTEGAFSEKLKAISAVYTSFEGLTAERFLDPDERLNRIYDRLGHCRYFEGKKVFVDSFKGFTGSQLKILDRIFAQSSGVTVGLCLDKSVKAGVFDNAHKLYNDITGLARAHGIGKKEDIILADSHYENAGVSSLERLMAFGKIEETENSAVTVCRAATIFDEAEFVARTIRKLVRKEGNSFKDFVVIACDTSVYEQALDSACKRNGVNCFIDRRMQFLSMPAAVCVVSAMEAAIRPTTENILAFHKSGIDMISAEELSKIENYTYLWNLKGRDFEREWDMNPAGFTDREPNQKKLDEINKLRLRAVNPISEFRFKFKGSAAERGEAIFRLLENCNAVQTFRLAEKRAQEDGNPQFSDALRSSFRELVLLLDSLAVCFGEDEITTREYYDAFCRAAALVTVGVVPQTLDEVTFGAADRIRPSRPKYVFILGAAQGVFPKALPSGGILSVNERAELSDLGIKISDCSIVDAVDEDFLVYTSVCCASRGVFITYPDDYCGVAATPSAFVSLVCEAFMSKVLREPCGDLSESLPETVEGAFSELCRRTLGGGCARETLKSALEKTKLRSRVNSVLSDNASDRFSLFPDTARGLFGDSIGMSPSRFDDFSRCRFMFFCKDGLGVRPLQPAEFDNMQRGTIVHYVLQRVIEVYGKGIGDIDRSKISEIVYKYTEEYLDRINGYRSIENTYLRFLVVGIKRSLNHIVEQLSDEFAQSEFEPVSCELHIGKSGDVPEIKIPLEGDAELSLHGIVDRLDSWNGYIRIVDYKTGSRSFRLPDILFGQNMQMLIYLYAVSKSLKYGGKPAGILYMPASYTIDEGNSKRRMNGLLVDDKDVLLAMEKKLAGKFIPKNDRYGHHNFINDGEFEKIFDYIEQKLSGVGNEILSGEIAPSPIDGIDSGACKYCDFSAICYMKNEEHPKVPQMTNEEVLDVISGEVSKSED